MSEFDNILTIFNRTLCSDQCSYHTAHSACLCIPVAPRRIHLLMKMNEIFARHGSPDKVGSDNGSQFNHAEFAKT